ncbi:MAG TPA: hypothetical protein VHG72_05185 [Polyangia bacterium]|nr:hypothetical protein [Polyangia bacterium]
MISIRGVLCLGAGILWLSACGQSDSGTTGSGGSTGTGTGGRTATGGATGTGTGGITTSTGGALGTGGVTSTGGTPGTGGTTVGTGGATSTGGRTGTGGTTGTGGVPGTGGAPSTGGTTGTGGATSTGGAGGALSCSSSLTSRVRITEIDVGASYAYNEVDNNGAALGLTPLAISPIPGGGSRLAFLEKGASTVHVITLDGNDQVTGTPVTIPGYDFQDIYADASGGVMLISRDALGGSAADHNCGNINNLCGLVANYPTAASCYDMYMVRFDGTTETWATKLTDTTASSPGYMTGTAAKGDTTFVWSEYAHNGRIAFDGANYAGYYGIAISVVQSCVGSSTLTTGVNIHQGDQMKVVNSSGALQTTPGFGIGCSHSGYERVVYDPTGKKFVPVCKNDAPTGTKSGRIALAPNTSTIEPVDLSYSDLGNVVNAGGGGYWIITSDIRAGQTANSDGLADIHLLKIASTTALTPNPDTLLVSDAKNDRAPHLVPYGAGQVLAAWEESTATGDLSQTDKNRQMYIQLLDSTSGGAPSGSSTTTAGPLAVSPNVLGSRYQDFRAFPDGSVAYPAPGSAATKIKILRVLPCQ